MICPASGEMPNFTRLVTPAKDGRPAVYAVGCSFCEAEWLESELVDGNLPEHEVVERKP